MADVATGKQVVAPTRTAIKTLDHGQVHEIMIKTREDTVDAAMVDVIEASADEITAVVDLRVDIVIHHE